MCSKRETHNSYNKKNSFLDNLCTNWLIISDFIVVFTVCDEQINAFHMKKIKENVVNHFN